MTKNWAKIFCSQKDPCRCFGSGVLNQLVKVDCVPLISDGDAKRHKVYTGSGDWYPTFSLRDRSCIPCTEVLVVGGYKLGERERASPRSRRGTVRAA